MVKEAENGPNGAATPMTAFTGGPGVRRSAGRRCRGGSKYQDWRNKVRYLYTKGEPVCPRT